MVLTLSAKSQEFVNKTWHEKAMNYIFVKFPWEKSVTKLKNSNICLKKGETKNLFDQN